MNVFGLTRSGVDIGPNALSLALGYRLIIYKFKYLHAPHPFSRFIIPLERFETVAIELGERVHEVRAKGGVDVFGEVLALVGPVLGPVCVVAHAAVLACRRRTGINI